MSSNDQADRKAAQPFGFHQLRQACEISTLRQDIARILADTADLQILIEKEVEQVRQHLGGLSPADLQDAGKLSPLLSEAVTALIEIREVSRHLEAKLPRREHSLPAHLPPPPVSPADTVRPPPPSLARTGPPKPPPQASRPAPPTAAPPPQPMPAPVTVQVATAAAHPAYSPPPPPPPTPPTAPRTAANRAKVMNWLMPANR